MKTKTKRRLWRYGKTASLALLLGVPALFGAGAWWNQVHPPPGASWVEDCSGQPTTPTEPCGELRLVTFNVQDVPFCSGDRTGRMKAIASALIALSPDVVGFQEVWMAADRRLLAEELAKGGLPHHWYAASGLGGSGLLTVSRHPIVRRGFMRFRQSVPWYVDFSRPDWWGAKGISFTTVDCGALGHVDFFNTHLQAPYRDRPWVGVRVSQLADAASFIGGVHRSSLPCALCGDFNTRFDTGEEDAELKKMPLLPLLPPASGVDQVLAFHGPPWTWRVLETQSISKPFPNALSDHLGWLCRVELRRAK